MPSLDKGFYYLVSEGGNIKGQKAEHLKNIAILNNQQSGDIVLNELSTIGSTYPNAQLMHSKDSISGSESGLLIGSSQVQNLVDVQTGQFGATVLDGSNVTYSETVGRMNTLASLTATCGAYYDASACKSFLELADADNTLDAIRNIAKAPYVNSDELFKLFEETFPYPEHSGVRETQFKPYLELTPDDFSLMVRINGGGIFSAGRMMFDNQGQLWSGQNWEPGNQASLTRAIGGGMVRLSASGKALSPQLTGYNDQGLDGIGWGTTVSQDKVWASSFNGKVGVLDLQGTKLGAATIHGKHGALQGLATAPNGDVWLCDNQMNQMILFPKGDQTNGQIVKVPGLKRPFAVAVDNQNNVWVTNNGFVTVTKFSPDKPEDAMQINVGAMAPRGLAIDSAGYVWVSNNFSMGYPLAKIPEGASIIDEFKLNIEKVVENEKVGINKTGLMTLISPEGKVIKKDIVKGDIYAGWGVSLDGQDNVFASNFLGESMMQVCGTDTSKCPTGMETGDLIHNYRSGIIQKLTDTMVDDAGNVWVANNWDQVPALLDNNPDRRIAGNGGGTGISVIYGIASPVQNPLIGQVRSAN
ncbi:hypothetical protein AB4254_20940 [Vibrio breoganii]